MIVVDSFGLVRVRKSLLQHHHIVYELELLLDNGSGLIERFFYIADLFDHELAVKYSVIYMYL